MNNWAKIQSFKRIHQAELIREILEKNEIEAVIINEKDSLFLVGEIELYVENENEKKAKALINEFNGLTKINSFIDEKPVRLFEKILKDNWIETVFKRKEDSKYLLDNFELYIDNENLHKAVPFLTGEKLDGYSIAKTCKKVRQTKFYVEILEKNNIEALVIKKKDSDYHIEEVFIYVKNEVLTKAKQLFTELHGFSKIKKNLTRTYVEQLEETLAQEGIKSLISKNQTDKLDLYVKSTEVDKAEEIINLNKEWVKISEFDSVTNATFYKNALQDLNIPSVIVNEKDSTFLVGIIELFVEKQNFDKVNEYLDSINAENDIDNS